MTERERAAAIKAHLAAHEEKHRKRKLARISSDARKKKRGLAALVARLKTVA